MLSWRLHSPKGMNQDKICMGKNRIAGGQLENTRMAEYNIEKFDKTARGEKGEVGLGGGVGRGRKLELPQVR